MSLVALLSNYISLYKIYYYTSFTINKKQPDDMTWMFQEHIRLVFRVSPDTNESTARATIEYEFTQVVNQDATN